MTLNVAKELAELRRMSVADLRSRYAEVFGETTNTRHKDWLVKRVIWRMQALAEGDLSERARQRAAELANDADLRTAAAQGANRDADAGRTRRGQAADQRRLPAAAARHGPHPRLQGRDAPGEGAARRASSTKARSTSRSRAVAKAITGSHCNGYLFFRLTRQGGDR